MTRAHIAPASFAASAVLFVASLASALAAPPPNPVCGDGPACEHGFECTVVARSGCTAAPCPPGDTCPVVDPCAVTETMGCTPAHCGADADCASGMVCETYTEPCATTNCACAPGEKCDCPITTCEPTTVSTCTPRYLLPCASAADCGDGFTCEEQSSGCACAGSAGSSTPGSAPAPSAGGSSSAGGAPPTDAMYPVPMDCTCEATTRLTCVAREIACETDAACPAGWSCRSQLADVPVCEGPDCAAAIPQPTGSSCVPPYYGALASGEPPVAAADGSAVPSKSEGAAESPRDLAEGGDAANESSACQFGPASGDRAPWALAALLGVVFGWKRRRAQR